MLSRPHFRINSTSTLPLPDHFPIASRALAYSISTRLFWQSKSNRVWSPIDADHPDHLRDRFPIAWSGLIELIWSVLKTIALLSWRTLCIIALLCFSAVCLSAKMARKLYRNRYDAYFGTFWNWNITARPLGNLNSVAVVCIHIIMG